MSHASTPLPTTGPLGYVFDRAMHGDGHFSGPVLILDWSEDGQKRFREALRWVEYSYREWSSGKEYDVVARLGIQGSEAVHAVMAPKS